MSFVADVFVVLVVVLEGIEVATAGTATVTETAVATVAGIVVRAREPSSRQKQVTTPRTQTM